MARKSRIKGKKPATLNLLTYPASGDQSGVSTAGWSPPDVSPRAIALAQISKLSRSIESGENLQECANALEAIASIATMELWRMHSHEKSLEAMKSSHPKEAQKMAARNEAFMAIALNQTELPAMVGQRPELLDEVRELPIGSGLAYNLSKARSDHLLHVIEDLILGQFQGIRLESKPHPVGIEAEIQKLHALSKESARDWAVLATRYIDEYYPKNEHGSYWLFDACLGGAITELKKERKKKLLSREKTLKKLRRKVEHLPESILREIDLYSGVDSREGLENFMELEVVRKHDPFSSPVNGLVEADNTAEHVTKIFQLKADMKRIEDSQPTASGLKKAFESLLIAKLKKLFD